MLSDESSTDSETGRFKSTSKSTKETANTSRREDSSKFSRRPRHSDDRSYRDLSRRNDDRDKLDRRSRDRDRSRYSRYSPARRRSPDRHRHRRSDERQRYSRTSREKSKQREHLSPSKDKSRSQKSPTRSRNIKDEIKGVTSNREKSTENVEHKKSLSPDNTPKMSVVLKPDKIETPKQKSESPILIEEHESDNLEVVQPGSYYSMIPAVVKEKSEESSEIDSSDDEKLRAKLLNLEKQLQKTKKKKHKRKHKKKSSKEKSDNSVEVSSTSDIHQAKMDNTVSSTGTPEVTSTQKSNQKESSEEGEISSDDSQSKLEIDADDLRHKLKRSKLAEDSEQSKLDVCGPALPPHLEKRFKRRSPSPASKSPQAHTPPTRSNIGPSIPDDMRKVLADKSNDVVYASSEDEGIGPLPVGSEDKWSEAHQRLEERAVELKIKKLDGSSVNSSNVKSREQWMLELPEGKAKIIGLEARTFRAKEGPDMSDRSAWTDTPEEKARKAAGIVKEEDSSTALQREARERHIVSRDEEQEKAVRKHKKKHKREESLLDIHQKKLKKKKKKEEKDDEKKERRPFSRDIDLQVNRFDEAQKKSIIKKAQGLNTRFSSGEAKYL